MNDKTPAEKGHIKPGSAIALVNEVPSVVDALGLPPDVTFVDIAEASLVLLFANSRAELETLMPDVVGALGPQAVLWVFFRKGSVAAGLDMNRDNVWATAESKGMRPLGLIGVDETWSAFRLRRA